MHGPEYLQSPDKRRFDIACGLGALATGGPGFLAGIGAAFVASGSGRPFFSQERDNYQGGTFTVHKLRSLNDAKVAASEPADFGTFDPRTGKIGNLLRVSGIDEFPQLFNVLDGSMSFIGPRPVPTYILDEWRDIDPPLFDDWREASVAAKPGLLSPGTLVRKTTGARGKNIYVESMRADLEYIEKASLREDARILGQAACKGIELAKSLIQPNNRIETTPAS